MEAAGRVDVHSHVLWELDDGARSRAEALEMVRRAAASGTTTLFATPHVAPGWAFSPARLALRDERLAELRELAPPGLELRAGWEVTPSEDIVRGDVEHFRLEGTGHVLVDGPQNGPWRADPWLFPLVERVVAAGLVPIVAHPERRASPRHPTRDPDMASRLREAGALVQIDATGLNGRDGPAAQDEAERLLAAGIADLIASDAHGARPDTWPELDRAHADAARLGGEALAARLDATAQAIALGGRVA